MADTKLKTRIESVRARLDAEPAKGVRVVRAESRQRSGFESEAKAGECRLVLDQPPALGGAARGPRPGEVVLMALASCQEHTYRVHAALLGIPLDDIHVELEGLVDGRGFLGDESVTPGFSEVRGTVTIRSSASETELARLQEAVDRHCPVLDDLRRPVPVTLALRNEGRSSE